MASPQAISSESDEEFHSLSGRDPDGGKDETRSQAQQHVEEGRKDEVSSDDDSMEDEHAISAAPQHPFPSLQGAFEESIEESAHDINHSGSAQDNAEARRQKLLEAQQYDESWVARWKQRPGVQHHPLMKLMAQITFGMHLLQQNQAKSDQEVVKILQSHVDEVDNFLEQTSEDFELAIRDIDERIRFLQLPMEHLDVFDIMLDDKKFRTQLLDGNDKIEKIIDRTAKAMNAALLDVQKGRQATKELGKYLNNVQAQWPNDKPDLEAIFTAMRGNEEGWKQCYKELQTKGNNLGNKLIQLGTVIGEMSRMAATASRRTVSQTKTKTGASSPVPRSISNADAKSGSTPSLVMNKPLPRAPDASDGAARSNKNFQRPISYHQRFEQPRNAPPTPKVAARGGAEKPDNRPRTSGSFSHTKDHRNTNGNLIDFRKSLGPAHKHSPAVVDQRPKSAGHATANGSFHTRPAVEKSPVGRSQTHTGIKSSSRPNARVPSGGVDAERKNRDNTFKDSKDAFSGATFARRWSIRKRFVGAVPEDYEGETATVATTAGSNLKKSPSASGRLGTVMEQPDGASSQKTTQTAEVSPHVDERKHRNSSLRLGRNTNRKSVVSVANTASPARSSLAPSMASSVKRHSLSLKSLFHWKSRSEAVN